MAKAKKTVKKSARKTTVLQKNVDNKFSILLMILALLVFVLAAVSMSQ